MLRMSGRHPYVANDERRLLEVIRSQKLRFDSEKFRTLSPEGFFNQFHRRRNHQNDSLLGLDFLQGMLVYDTVHRRTMGELTVHRWLTVGSIRIVSLHDLLFFSLSLCSGSIR